MHRSINKFVTYTFSCAVLFSFCYSASAQNVRQKTITRIFWQDRESQKLSYADLATTDKWHIKRGWVKGFPQPANINHTLGPMLLNDTQLLVGTVGENENKLIKIDSGVYQRPHGSHFHWEYTNVPQSNFQLQMSSAFKLASTTPRSAFYNLTSGGFAKADWNSSNANASSFNVGGKQGALAIANETVGYAAWPDTEGENAGRVDVFSPHANPSSSAYKFNLPAGGIRAAAAASNKIFFSNQDGISWVTADISLSKREQNIPVAKIANSSIDELGSVPREFTSEWNWLLFVTSNSDGQANLGMINATTPNPNVLKLNIPIEKGLVLSAPSTKLSLGKRYAFLFQERADAASDLQEKLVVVELDPNHDGSFSDASVKAMVNVGKSKIDGDFGHHNICFDDYGRFAVFTDPGDGIINIMTLNDLTVRAKFRVGGNPDRIVAVGSPEHFH